MTFGVSLSPQHPEEDVHGRPFGLVVKIGFRARQHYGTVTTAKRVIVVVLTHRQVGCLGVSISRVAG